jgi:hypothetical protein
MNLVLTLITVLLYTSLDIVLKATLETTRTVTATCQKVHQTRAEFVQSPKVDVNIEQSLPRDREAKADRCMIPNDFTIYHSGTGVCLEAPKTCTLHYRWLHQAGSSRLHLR